MKTATVVAQNGDNLSLLLAIVVTVPGNYSSRKRRLASMDEAVGGI